MFLIEVIDGFHLLLVQGETEQITVRSDSGRVPRFGNDSSASLNGPLEGNLCRRLSNSCSNSFDHLVLVNRFGILPLFTDVLVRTCTKATVSCHSDAVLVAKVD